MKRLSRMTAVSFWVCLAVLVIVSGCETCKGMTRDVKNADEWVRDHMW